MIHLGFTGTRYGMTRNQYITVRDLVRELAQEHGRISVHHGSCVGADAEFHAMCMDMGVEIAQIYQHIPRDPKLRAYLHGGIREAPADYDVRNQAIVDQSHYVIGAPATDIRKGGTWQTIGFAEKKGNLWRVVYPSGVAIPA